MRNITVFLGAGLCLATVAAARAGGSGGGTSTPGTPAQCAACGCSAACRQVTCQIVCGYEEVEIRCWDCKTEEFCLPIPVLGSRAGGKFDCCCNANADNGCAGRCRSGSCEPQVTCGHARIKTILLLRTEKIKKPVYQCVTRYLCGQCEAQARPADTEEKAPAPEAAPLPLAPKQAILSILSRF